MSIPYDIVVTAVSHRADLFVATLESLLAQLDAPPCCILVHEDRPQPGKFDGMILDWLEEAQAAGRFPAFKHKVGAGVGLAGATAWGLKEATSLYVFYTQEDFEFLRPLPMQHALRLMDAHNLHHIRFNKRKTMPSKGADKPKPFVKVPVTFEDPLTGALQVLCISDAWYFQAALWRRDLILPAACKVAANPPALHIPRAITRLIRIALTGTPMPPPTPAGIHEKLRTYIWGPVGEHAFCHHTGNARRSQSWVANWTAPYSKET